MKGLQLFAQAANPTEVRVSAPVFQIIALSVLGLLLLRDLWNWSRPYPGKFVRLLRCLVWIGAGVAIAEQGFPEDHRAYAGAIHLDALDTIGRNGTLDQRVSRSAFSF